MRARAIGRVARRSFLALARLFTAVPPSTPGAFHGTVVAVVSGNTITRSVLRDAPHCRFLLALALVAAVHAPGHFGARQVAQLAVSTGVALAEPEVSVATHRWTLEGTLLPAGDAVKSSRAAIFTVNSRDTWRTRTIPRGCVTSPAIFA